VPAAVFGQVAVLEADRRLTLAERGRLGFGGLAILRVDELEEGCGLISSSL